MEPRTAVGVVAAVLAITVAGVELAVGEKGVAVVLVRTDRDGTYLYKERIVTSVVSERGGATLEGSVLAGESLVEVASLAPCAGGNEIRCLAGDERPKVSPCVRATGADCFRTAPGRPRRFFGLGNTFPLVEASGTQCAATTCTVIAGDSAR